MRVTLLAVAVSVSGFGVGCDPVNDAAVSALGPETQGIPRGPLHRAGQPCRTCHDGALGNPPEFSVAGSVFQNAGDLTAAENATVILVSANDAGTYQATTNAAGNFYVQPRQFIPTYPMHVQVTFNGTLVNMTSHVGRDGSCADCHLDPAGPTSAGHIYIPAGGVTP